MKILIGACCLKLVSYKNMHQSEFLYLSIDKSSSARIKTRKKIGRTPEPITDVSLFSATLSFLSPPEGGLDLVTNRQGAI